MGEYYTRSQLAKMLNVTIKTIDNYRKQGLKSVKPGGTVFISKEDFEEWMNK